LDVDGGETVIPAPPNAGLHIGFQGGQLNGSVNKTPSKTLL
jgi:hypothetical protein